MISFAPLWADADWIRALVPLIALGIWALNRLLGGDSPAAKQRKARELARAKPPQPPADKQRVEDEVGEFLRRAAQQKSGKETRPAQPPRPPKSTRRPLTDISAGRRPVAAPEPEPTDVFARPVGTISSLEPSIEQRTLPDRVASSEIEQSTDAMKSHLQQTFGHQVGTIAGAPASDADAPQASPPNPIVDFTGLLREPQNIRDAIVISEILRRPEHRW